MANITEIIGRLPVPRGIYSTGVTYYKYNLVQYLGSTYMSKIDGNTTAPATQAADGKITTNANWEIWADASEITYLKSVVLHKVAQTLSSEEQIQVKKNISPGGYIRALAEAVEAVYNESTGFYELNGLTDITEAQMSKILAYATSSSSNLDYYYKYTKIRTNVRSDGKQYISTKLSIRSAFINSTIEVIFFSTENLTNSSNSIVILDINYAFYNCTKLKRIIGILDISSCTTIISAFTLCTSLETIYLNKLNASISFASSSKLTKESILFMITNSAATSPITITLYPTAYAMAQADSEIQAALVLKPNVSLASA